MGVENTLFQFLKIEQNRNNFFVFRATKTTVIFVFQNIKTNSKQFMIYVVFITNIEAKTSSFVFKTKKKHSRSEVTHWMVDRLPMSHGS